MMLTNWDQSCRWPKTDLAHARQVVLDGPVLNASWVWGESGMFGDAEGWEGIDLGFD